MWFERCLLPQPNPLPLGEGTAAVRVSKIRKPSSKSQPWYCQDAGNNSPSLLGRGPGGGESALHFWMGNFHPLHRYKGIFSKGAAAVMVWPPFNFLPVHASVHVAAAGR